MLEVLKSLEVLNLLPLLYKHGIINDKVRFHYELYLLVDRDMKTNKSSKTVAVEKVAEDMKVTAMTVWNALKKMQG